MPRVEARLRELVHRDPPVAGGGWLAIARELHRGYASPQKSRLRARLEWCIGERYILPDGPGHYVLVPARSTGGLSARLLLAAVDRAALPVLEDAPKAGGVHSRLRKEMAAAASATKEPPATNAPTKDPIEISLDKISPVGNIREVTGGELATLVDSVRQHGVIEPVLLVSMEGYTAEQRAKFDPPRGATTTGRSRASAGAWPRTPRG